MTLLEFALVKRALRKKARPHTHHFNKRIGLVSNVHCRVVDRETGEVKRTHHAKNTITNVPLLVDLIMGSSGDHLSSGANLRILDSGGGQIKIIGTQRSGFPTAASGALVTVGWEDLTDDAYNPDDLELQTTGGVKVAETLNVAWSNKLATENWFFDWDLSMSSGDSSFDNAGFDAMLDCITGAQSQHFDGTEGSSNMRIQVFDGTPGSLEFSQTISEAATQPSSTQIRWRFTKAAGGTWTWGRVEVENNAPSTTLLYDDDITNQNQGANDAFTYQFTMSFS